MELARELQSVIEEMRSQPLPCQKPRARAVEASVLPPLPMGGPFGDRELTEKEVRALVRDFADER